MQTKVMRSKKGCYSNAAKEFVAGYLFIDKATGELYKDYKPGMQFQLGKMDTVFEMSPYVTLYTVIEIKPFTNKRNRTA